MRFTLEVARAGDDLRKAQLGRPDFAIGVPLWMGVLLYGAEARALVKGAGHKYIKRIPTGNARRPWRYVYSVGHAGGAAHEEHFVEGAAFKLASNGKEGHFHVTAVDGDHVTIEHDETGHSERVHKNVLRAMIQQHHAEAIGQHRDRLKGEIEAASKKGSEKQQARLAEQARASGHGDLVDGGGDEGAGAGEKPAADGAKAAAGEGKPEPKDGDAPEKPAPKAEGGGAQAKPANPAQAHGKARLEANRKLISEAWAKVEDAQARAKKAGLSDEEIAHATEHMEMALKSYERRNNTRRGHDAEAVRTRAPAVGDEAEKWIAGVEAAGGKGGGDKPQGDTGAPGPKPEPEVGQEPGKAPRAPQRAPQPRGDVTPTTEERSVMGDVLRTVSAAMMGAIRALRAKGQKVTAEALHTAVARARKLRRKAKGGSPAADGAPVAKSLTGPVPDGGVEVPDWLGDALLMGMAAALLKGAGHKYVKRIPTSNPKRPWRYIYHVGHAGGVANHEHIKVGAAFAITDGGKAGHFHVVSVDGDSVTIRHDETGRTATMPKHALKQMLLEQHARAIGAHREKIKRDLAAVAKHGTEKQRRRIEAEAKRAGHSDLVDKQKIQDAKEAREARAKAEKAAASSKPKLLIAHSGMAWSDRDDGLHPGDVTLMNADRVPHVVVGRDSYYIREDGRSFGIDDDRGWKVTYRVRPLTKDEQKQWDAYAADLEAHKATASAARDLTDRRGGDLPGVEVVTGSPPADAEAVKMLPHSSNAWSSQSRDMYVEKDGKHVWVLHPTGGQTYNRIPVTPAVQATIDFLRERPRAPSKPRFDVTEADKAALADAVAEQKAREKKADEDYRARSKAESAKRAAESSSILNRKDAESADVHYALGHLIGAKFGGVQANATATGLQLYGDTFAHKEAIRAAGGKWDRGQRRWTLDTDAALKMAGVTADKIASTDFHARRAKKPAASSGRPPSSGRQSSAAPRSSGGGLRAEKVGRRVYVEGNTYAHKDKLKARGFKWDGDRRAWWIGSAGWAKHGDYVQTLKSLDANDLLKAARRAAGQGG